MELIENLFMGYPNLWGGGVAHSVLILSLVITIGIALGKVKVAGVSLGITWILFVGIIFGHFNMNLDEHLLHFLKEFGLILFVYSIGLQVGPGFFSAFKKGGLTLNMVAMTVVFSGVILAIVLHFVSGVPITTMVGILSGAVTNTPGLGAAQQANSDLNGVDAPEIALGYAVAYPLGVIGCILSLWGLKYILRVKVDAEEADAQRGSGHLQELTVRPVTIEIHNEFVIGKRLRDVRYAAASARKLALVFFHHIQHYLRNVQIARHVLLVLYQPCRLRGNVSAFLHASQKRYYVVRVPRKFRVLCEFERARNVSSRICGCPAAVLVFPALSFQSLFQSGLLHARIVQLFAARPERFRHGVGLYYPEQKQHAFGRFFHRFEQFVLRRSKRFVQLKDHVNL